MVLREIFSLEFISKSVFSGILVVKFYAYCCTEYVNISIQALLISQRELQHLHRVFISPFVHTSSLAYAIEKTITNLPSLVNISPHQVPENWWRNILIPKVSKGNNSRQGKNIEWYAPGSLAPVLGLSRKNRSHDPAISLSWQKRTGEKWWKQDIWKFSQKIRVGYSLIFARILTSISEKPRKWMPGFSH